MILSRVLVADSVVISAMSFVNNDIVQYYPLLMTT